MAHAANLTQSVLNVVTAQVDALLRGVFDPARFSQAQIEIVLTFETLMLEADAIIQPTDDIEQLVSPAVYWHHQVAINGETEFYARSKPEGADPESWRVVELFESQLAEKISQSMRWVNDNVGGDPLVRLLIVPVYQLHAFWLITEIEEEQVFVIDCPPQLINLQPEQLLSEKGFLEALRREPHIVGRIRS